MKTEKVTVHLEPGQHLLIRRIADQHESTISGTIRKAVRLLEDGHQLPRDDFNPHEWKFDHAELHMVAALNIYRPKTGNGARAYKANADGQSLWVLPDDTTSGQLRSRTIRDALASCHGSDLDPLPYVAGCLHRVGATRLYWQEET